MGTIAGLLLAAGAGRRYGMPKALVQRGDRLLVEHGLTTLHDGGTDPVVIVLGAQHEEVAEKADLAGATVIVNRDWDTGMASSLRAGLTALASTSVDAAVVLLVDTPGITPDAVRRIASYASPDALATATYDGEIGHPVLLGRAHWDGVMAAATGDRGARPYLRARHDDVLMIACDDVA